MMYQLLVVASFVLVASTRPLDQNLDEHWKLFKSQHGKQYSDGTESHRRAIWEENVERIAKHNREYDMGMHTYTVGLNKYADLTDEEHDMMKGYIPPKDIYKHMSEYIPPVGVTYPKSVDWRKKALVTAVKDQGTCGSCWAFSAVGTLEGQFAKSTGKLVRLSEQNLVDCSKVNYGCEGGWSDQALLFIMENKGIDSEKSYPYTGKDGTCHYDPKNKVTSVKEVYGLRPKGDENVLKSAVATVGPISVAINASGFGFNYYRGGVYVDKYCYAKLDHAVLAVGYGTDDKGQDFWIVKNSWGESYGESGYIRMARNNNNQCGIASDTCYPTV